MRFLRRKTDSSIGKLQMAPMVDVVFQLLIFFLVASEVRPTEAEFRADLRPYPPNKVIREPKPVPDEIFRVFLRTLDEGRSVEVSINGEVLGRGGAGFKTLTERLCRLDGAESVILVIDGDPTVRTQFVTNVLDCASAARIRQVTFARGRM